MTFKDDLTAKVGEFARDDWGDIPNAYVLPDSSDLSLGNQGEHLNVTVLYADIQGSTDMVDTLSGTRAAELYKSFLHCASKIITRNSGEIQAYDGDRVMAVYVGDEQADNAVSTALEINYAVAQIINPTFARIYQQFHRPLKHTVGIDSGQVLAIRVGVRVVGELAWIGASANYAAKLNSFSGLDPAFPTRVTANTMIKLTSKSLLGSGGESIWQGPYNDFPTRNHYRTSYHRAMN